MTWPPIQIPQMNTLVVSLRRSWARTPSSPDYGSFVELPVGDHLCIHTVSSSRHLEDHGISMRDIYIIRFRVRWWLLERHAEAISLDHTEPYLADCIGLTTC